MKGSPVKILLLYALLATAFFTQAQNPVFTNPITPAPYDISEFVYQRSMSLAAEETSPRSIAFNLDGTKMFITGTNGSAVVEYDLGVAYSISSAIHAGESEEISVVTEGMWPYDMSFSSDGTKMIIISRISDALLAYNLGTAFDVSTAVYTGDAEQFSIAEANYEYSNVTFNSDGLKMFLFQGNTIVEFNLTTAYDISTAVDAGETEELDVDEIVSNPNKITFSADGMKLFVTGDDSIVEFNLTTAYDVSSAVHAGIDEELLVINQTTVLEKMTFNNDGTKMFLVESNGQSKVFEYVYSEVLDYAENATTIIIDIDANDGLGGANDVSITYNLTGDDASLFSVDASGVITFNTPPDFENPLDIDYNNSYLLTCNATNGTNISQQHITIHVSNINDTPIFTDIGQGFDISTAVYTGVSEALLIANTETDIPRDIVFNDEGTKMYIVGETIMEYNLPIPYDVSGAAYAGESEEFSVVSQERSVSGMAFNHDGSQMYIVGGSGDAVVEYHLGTAYDISSAVYAGEAEELDVGDQVNSPSSLSFNPDGTEMYIGSLANGTHEYHLTTGFDVSTAVYAEASEILFATKKILFNTDGTKTFFLHVGNDEIYEYWMDTPYNISRLNYVGNSENFELSADDELSSLAFDANGTKMFVLELEYNGVLEYKLATEIYYEESQTIAVIDIDANDGLGGAEDTGITYQLTGTDASLFNVNSLGQIYFNASPNYETPLDANGDNVYHMSILVQNATGEISQDIVINIVDIEDTPIFTHIGQGYDVSKIKPEYTIESISLGTTATGPSDVMFDNSGTTMFIIDANSDYVVEYQLRAPYDITTVEHSGSSEELYVRDEDMSPFGGTFNQDGTKFYLLGSFENYIIEYDLSSAYDISTAVHLGEAEEYHYQNQELSGSGVKFNNNGTKMFIVGEYKDAVSEYTLSTAYDVSSASYAGDGQALDIGDQEDEIQALEFNSDGTILYITGEEKLAILKYNLTIGFDVSTATYAGDDEMFSIANRITGPGGMTFNQDGTKLFVVDLYPDSLVSYTLPSLVSHFENSNEDLLNVDAKAHIGGLIDDAINYSLGGIDAAIFRIDEEGIITFRSTPDFENPLDNDSDNVYEIEIIATTVETNRQPMLITVVDQAIDDFPTITSDGTLEVIENITGTIYTATADKTVTFSLGTKKDEALFTLNTDVVGFVSAPDFETPLDENIDNEYLVDIIATDESGNVTIKEVSISITNEVEPEDNNAPIISSIASITIAENTPSTEAILDVNATDGNGGAEDANISYMLSGTDAARFIIDESNGQIRFIATPDFENPLDANADNTYEITVTANDGESANNVATQNITISISDIDETSSNNLPVLSANASISVLENTSIDTVILDIEATDGDGGAVDENLTYTLSGIDAADFTINNENGEIQFVEAPNYENPSDNGGNNQYEITVTADDGASANNLANQDIIITVTDDTDEAIEENTAPRFNSVSELSIAENIATTTAVLDINATDGNGGSNDENLTYTLSGTDASDFSIDSDNGEIFFLEIPDFETPADEDQDNNYQITITADDGESENNSTEQAITITVTDVIDETTTVLSIEDDQAKLGIYGSQSGMVIKYTGATTESVMIYTPDGKLVFKKAVQFDQNKALIHAGLSTNQLYILQINHDRLKFIIQE